MVTLRTERLTLRPARADDLDAIHALLSNPRAMAYWSTPPHTHRDQSREWLAGMIATAPDEGVDFVIAHHGRVIGKAGFYRFPEIGYILDPALWGQGLAGEALRAVLGHVFTAHGLERAVADVDPRNAASLRLLERLGFRETGRAAKTWLVGREWCDSVYLALDRKDWPQRTA
ncbi:GNAT family N-acetyltransferase [Novosphingobium album (ex Liu et al. 2023)]|uniref:GNAT family protein n=1 Tax=Novosphingobium album (ex Liu et al. 2023) TaxID=3031130 RepID=A0ABT5WNJ1_9SPHN|nr:GNAT family protein [Novosphingobium album (ex Liu et al. 2023)]MDE8651602.1 GNAT family protein [Novosphingobium album (ex Liu et al. 2023)]